MKLLTEGLHYDLHEDLISLQEAADLVNVTKRAIHNWVTRGYCRQDGTRLYLKAYPQPEGRYFKPIDVLRAEATTRHRARRASGSHVA